MARAEGRGGAPSGGMAAMAPRGSAETSLLTQVRGTLPGGRANARTVAALTENPGCTRRRVIDSAGIRADQLAKRTGHPTVRGQSPFAIASGTMFEWRLKEGTRYELLFEALKERFAFDAANSRVLDINRAPGKVGSEAWLIERARQTDVALAAMARGDSGAPNLVDHPVLMFDLAGVRMYLEPDALAFRIEDRLEVVEVKSYPVIDDQADPSKVASTAGQAAVYVLALRSAMERLGVNPDLVAWSAILIAPRNFSRQPTAHRIPLRKKASAISRVLASLPSTIKVLATLPKGFTLGPDVDPKRLTESTVQALGAIQALYVPECLASCDLAQFCRAEAILRDDVGRIGRLARDTLAGVASLSDVMRLAREPAGSGNGPSSDIAEALCAAGGALDRARSAAPASCGVNPAEEGRGRSRDGAGRKAAGRRTSDRARSTRR